jgi:3-deoxy-manno-octulosonate cytidylyltransferase (CMP-KDO synthetase)
MPHHAIVLIPARMAATRLPGKPLADIQGLPMIVHVLRRAEAAGVGPAVVATDSEAVAAAVEKAGGRALMTRADHVSGSDRIYEALQALDPERRFDIVVNVQGDLPTVDPADIRAALTPLADASVDIATLAAEITDPSELINANVVKAILRPPRKERRLPPRSDESSRVGLYIGPTSIDTRTHHTSDWRRTRGFCRAVSFTRANAAGPGPHYHHIGVYAYRRAALARFVTLPPSANERREKLEQLRALDGGMRIDVVVVKSVPLGVDTPEELAKARALLGG